MNEEEIRTRLAAMGPMDFRAAETLARDIVADARPPLYALHRVVASPGSRDHAKGQAVLRTLGELSVLPWLAAARQLSGADQAQAVFEAWKVYAALEQRIAERLRAMLEQRTALPPPDFSESGEFRPPTVRECDEAYLLLRRLHAPDEPEAERGEVRSAFVRSPERNRDERIEHYRHREASRE